MRAPRTRKELANDPRVSCLWYEPGNGWVLCLTRGWIDPVAVNSWEMDSIREPTLREVAKILRHVRRAFPWERQWKVAT